jgi:hypothetical protein
VQNEVRKPLLRKFNGSFRIRNSRSFVARPLKNLHLRLAVNVDAINNEYEGRGLWGG